MRIRTHPGMALGILLAFCPPACPAFDAGPTGGGMCGCCGQQFESGLDAHTAWCCQRNQPPPEPTPAEKAAELVRSARYRFQQGDYQEALRLFREAQGVHETTEGRLGIALATAWMEDGRVAISDLESFLGDSSCGEHDELIRRALGHARNEEGRRLIRDGRYDEAIQEFERAWGVWKDDAYRSNLGQAWNRKGTAAIEAGDYGGGIAALREACSWDVSHEDNLAWAWFRNARALDQAGDRQSAERAYREVLKLDSRDSAALNNLATLLRRQGNLDEAIDLYKQAVAANPGDTIAGPNLAGALLEKGRHLEDSGDPETAEAIYQQAENLGVANEETRTRLSAVRVERAGKLEGNDDIKRAREIYALAGDQRSVERLSLAQSALDSADLAFKQGDRVAAIRHLGSARANLPRSATVGDRLRGAVAEIPILVSRERAVEDYVRQADPGTDADDFLQPAERGVAGLLAFPPGSVPVDEAGLVPEPDFRHDQPATALAQAQAHRANLAQAAEFVKVLGSGHAERAAELADAIFAGKGGPLETSTTPSWPLQLEPMPKAPAVAAQRTAVRTALESLEVKQGQAQEAIRRLRQELDEIRRAEPSDRREEAEKRKTAEIAREELDLLHTQTLHRNALANVLPASQPVADALQHVDELAPPAPMEEEPPRKLVYVAPITDDAGNIIRSNQRGIIETEPTRENSR